MKFRLQCSRMVQPSLQPVPRTLSTSMIISSSITRCRWAATLTPCSAFMANGVLLITWEMKISFFSHSMFDIHLYWTYLFFLIWGLVASESNSLNRAGILVLGLLKGFWLKKRDWMISRPWKKVGQFCFGWPYFSLLFFELLFIVLAKLTGSNRWLQSWYLHTIH